MSKSSKMLYASLFLSFICGIFLGLIRGEIIFSSPYPAFYITAAVVCAISAISAYFVSSSVKGENKEGYAISDIPADWDSKYKKPVQIIQLISAFFILMAAVRIIVSSAFSPLNFINSAFCFACAISIFFRVKTKETAENTALLSLFPVFYLCFYLLLFYRGTARYPDLNLFGPHILTLSFLVITAYFNASTKFGLRLYFFRHMITLFSFTLCICDLIAYILNSQTLLITEAAVYLPTTCGFSLFYVCSLFIPFIKVFSVNSKKKKDEQEKYSD